VNARAAIWPALAAAAPIALAAGAACGEGLPALSDAVDAGSGMVPVGPDGGAADGAASAMAPAQPDAAPPDGVAATGAAAVDTEADAAGSGDRPDSAGTVLASGRATPAGIAVDASAVYWIELGASPDAGGAADAQVLACAKTGCGGSPTVLASGQAAGMSRLVAAGGRVYWFTAGRVLSCSTSGCGGKPTVVWSGAIQPADLAVDASGVVFTDAAGGDILRCPLQGCTAPPQVLWSSADAGSRAPALGLALDPARLYFSVVVDGAIYACPRAGCAGEPALLAAGRVPLQMVATGDGLFFLDAAASGNGRLVVLRSAGDGGLEAGATDLLDGLSVPTAVAVDDRDAYFTEDGAVDVTGKSPAGAGRVARCAIAGCGGLATPVAGYLNHPRGVAVDDTRVYWTDFGPTTGVSSTTRGRVMTRPK
jgi:hypothetical protein